MLTDDPCTAASYQDVVNGPYSQVLYQGKTEAAPSLLTGIEEIQSLLAKHNGTFLLGDEPSIGDLAVAPFVGRLFTLGKQGAFEVPLLTETVADLLPPLV